MPSSSSGKSSSTVGAVSSSYLSVSHAGQGTVSLGWLSSRNGVADTGSLGTLGISIGDDRTTKTGSLCPTFTLKSFLDCSFILNLSRSSTRTLSNSRVSCTLCILRMLCDWLQNILRSTVKSSMGDDKRMQWSGDCWKEKKEEEII